MVVFWKENSGPENEGGYETNHPSPPTITSFDDPDVPLGLWLRGPPETLLDPLHILDHRQDGLLLLHYLGGRERVRTGNTPLERLQPRSPHLEPQLIPIPMSDGDDDQPQPDERHRKTV